MGKPDISVEIGKLKIKNPLVAASGTFGYGTEYSGLCDIESFGAVVLKGITVEPRQGNPPPRIFETPCGMLNSIGLENCGIEAFVKEKLQALPDGGTVVAANLTGTAKEVSMMLSILEDAPVSACEINLSCPNLRGEIISSDSLLSGQFISSVRGSYSGQLWAKLSPRTSDIASVARACEEAGADAISLVNTFPAMAIDVENMRPVLGNMEGGLSGPAIRPAALKLVRDACLAVKIPVIGMGGIMTPGDALEFIMAGASAVGIGTAIFVSPGAPIEIASGIEDFLERKGFSSISQIRGAANAR